MTRYHRSELFEASVGPGAWGAGPEGRLQVNFDFAHDRSARRENPDKTCTGQRLQRVRYPAVMRFGVQWAMNWIVRTCESDFLMVRVRSSRLSTPVAVVR